MDKLFTPFLPRKHNPRRHFILVYFISFKIIVITVPVDEFYSKSNRIIEITVPVNEVYSKASNITVITVPVNEIYFKSFQIIVRLATERAKLRGVVSCGIASLSVGGCAWHK